MCTLYNIRATRAEIPRRPTGCMLQGLLFDAHGRRMHPDVVVRSGKTFAYYATELTREGQRHKLKVLRVGANEVEELAIAAFRTFLADRPALSEALTALGIYDAQTTAGLKAGPKLAAALRNIDAAAIRSVIRGVVVRAELSRERLVLFLSCIELARLLGWDAIGLFKPSAQVPGQLSSRTFRLDAPATIVKEARQICLPLPPICEGATAQPDPRLVSLIAEARDAQALIYANRDKTLLQLARARGCGPAFLSRLVRLNYLAPDIVAAIIDGTQPTGMNRTSLLKSALPLDWAQQRVLFGLPPRRDEGGTISRTARGHAPRSQGIAAL